VDMKTLKLSKEDPLVRRKWRRLIRGTEQDGINVSNCFL